MPVPRHVVDISDFVEGMVKADTFPSALDRHEWAKYQDAEVYLKGCAPTWAFMMAEKRLAAIARKVYFGDPSDSPVEIR